MLCICEKPKQAKMIAQAFPHRDKKGYIEVLPCEQFREGGIITYCIGHILELAPAESYGPYGSWSLEDLPILPQKFILKVTESKKQQYQIIKRFVHDTSKNLQTIVHAGDIGREGEGLILEALLHMGNKKPVKRLWTNSLTKSSVEKAFKNLRDIHATTYTPMYWEFLARQHSDWILGINMSRCISILLNNIGIRDNSGGFSVGRVQDVLANIVYRREKEIASFKSSPYWDVYGHFKIGKHSYTGKWFLDKDDHLFNQTQATALGDFCKGKSSYIYSVDKDKKEVRPPQFYNLTNLQAEVNKRIGLSPAEVLKVAQELYERSLISYPRSEPKHVTPEEAKMFPKIMDNLGKLPEYAPLLKEPLRDISSDKRYVDESKTDDHYAIILTEDPADLSSLSKNELFVYDLIARSMIAAHYDNAIFNHSEIITVVEGDFTFKSTGKQLQHEGWRVVFRKNEKEGNRSPDENGDSVTILPPVEQGETGVCESTSLIEGKTTSPKRFTQGDLVKIMENAGAYLSEVEKEGFKNSELSIGTVATRAGIISQVLNKKYIRVEKNHIFLEPKGEILIQSLKGVNYLTSPVTTGKMEQFLAQIGSGRGDYIKDYHRFVQRTKDITTEIIELTIESSKSWSFDSALEDLQASVEMGPCKICDGKVVDRGTFYGCSNYHTNKCEFSIQKRLSGKELSSANIGALLERGTTSLIKGFKKKNKEGTFDAFLVWDENEKRIKFNFNGVPQKKVKK
ncbi:type IA DNA topoisomerase [Metabacillus herbersteinensis]